MNARTLILIVLALAAAFIVGCCIAEQRDRWHRESYLQGETQGYQRGLVHGQHSESQK